MSETNTTPAPPSPNHQSSWWYEHPGARRAAALGTVIAILGLTACASKTFATADVPKGTSWYYDPDPKDKCGKPTNREIDDIPLVGQKNGFVAVDIGGDELGLPGTGSECYGLIYKDHLWLNQADLTDFKPIQGH